MKGRMKLILSLDDAHDVQTHATSPVVREILAHARRVLDGRGQIVIQQEFTNGPQKLCALSARMKSLIDGWPGLPNESLQRTAGLRFSQFVAQWPAAAEFRRYAKQGTHPRHFTAKTPTTRTEGPFKTFPLPLSDLRVAATTL